MSVACSAGKCWQPQDARWGQRPKAHSPGVGGRRPVPAPSISQPRWRPELALLQPPRWPGESTEQTARKQQWEPARHRGESCLSHGGPDGRLWGRGPPSWRAPGGAWESVSGAGGCPLGPGPQLGLLLRRRPCSGQPQQGGLFRWVWGSAHREQRGQERAEPCGLGVASVRAECGRL